MKVRYLYLCPLLFKAVAKGCFHVWNANVWKNRIKMFKINGDRSLMK